MKKLKTACLSKVLLIIIILGLVMMTALLITLPWSMKWIFEGTTFYQQVEHSKILILLYITGIPAWIILWMTKNLAINIIKRDPFSDRSVTSLRAISLCALFIFFCYLFTCVFVKMTLGMLVITAGAFLVALIAALLYRLVELAILIKEENDLTI